MSLINFPAKILLLGEYTVLNDSKALAIPYRPLTGRWSFENNDSNARENSRVSLFKFLEHAAEAYIDIDAFKNDLKRGLWFDSTIPQGYGLGSSGALIAALLQTYGRDFGSIESDKVQLARLEDFFHGSSSGLDPLVSHINKPILIHNFSEVEVVETSLHLDGFFLLNTGRPRQTGPLVSIYKEKLKDLNFKKGCENILGREVNFAIDAIIRGQKENIFHHLWQISKFQLDFFSEMIPDEVRDLWTSGLDSGDYILKLCGAGGGGFLLGHSNKLSSEELSLRISDFELGDLT